MKKLEYREIPRLVSRRLDGVPANIAERTESWIGKRARIEPCGRRVNLGGSNAGRVARHGARAGWVADLVRTLRHATGPAVSIGKIAVRIEHRVPVAGGERNNICNLPASDNLIRHTARFPEEPFTVTERKLVDGIEHEALTNVEIGIAVFGLWIAEVAKVAVVLRRSKVRV